MVDRRQRQMCIRDSYHVERLFGSFERSFELPANIDRSKVKALFNNGVLEVTLPLAEESKPKPVSYTHLRAHETPEHLVCRFLLEQKKQKS